MDFLLPVDRLRETEHLLAFRHPKPAHPFHIVIVPRKEIASFADLDPADPFLADLIAAAQSLAAEYRLPAYRLIVNGGAYQDFPQLHSHLVSDVLPHPDPSPAGRGVGREGK